MTLTAIWIDKQRDPKCPPLPEFPNGVDVDQSEGAMRTCYIDLPYPAKRCGIYLIHCDKCGQSNAITTAGRLDDPRQVTFGCFAHVMDPHPGLTEILPPGHPKSKRSPHP